MQTEDTKKKSKKSIVLGLIILLIILFLIGRNSCSQGIPTDPIVKDTIPVAVIDTNLLVDTLVTDTIVIDSAAIRDSIAQFKQDSIANELKNQKNREEWLKRKQLEKAKNDSIFKADSTLRALDSLKNLNRDTIPPYVYLDPPPGLYKEKITVSILSDEKGVMKYYKADDASGFSIYSKKIAITDSTIITFFGVDSVGNSTDTLIVEYHIHLEKNPCEKNMVFIKSKNVCVDKYEWPNVGKNLPINFVSLYGAIDSCESVGKRLCTDEEWKEAAGSKISKYPYGKKYSRRKCNTDSGKRAGSGKNKQCRSYHGAYDMTGNLAEWTSTKDANNPDFYKVYGGNFSSSSTATTKSYKFSYFPTNRYVGVGFRCCKTNDKE